MGLLCFRLQGLRGSRLAAKGGRGGESRGVSAVFAAHNMEATDFFKLLQGSCERRSRCSEALRRFLEL